MKLPEIEQEALALNEQERANLVLSLMDTLAAPVPDVSDEEAVRRDAELESGAVAALGQDEFVHKVQQSRPG